MEGRVGSEPAINTADTLPNIRCVSGADLSLELSARGEAPVPGELVFCAVGICTCTAIVFQVMIALGRKVA